MTFLTAKSGSARSGAKFSTPSNTATVSESTRSLNREYSSDHMMHRTLPVKSSMRNMAYLRPTLRPLLAVRTSRLVIIPPTRASVPFLPPRARSPASCVR